MKINLAKTAGFCFGVRRAIDIALKCAARGRDVYMLGDIVHNEDVVRKIERAGIIKIRSLKAGKNRALLIRAHGVPVDVIRRAKRLGYDIIDATCPMVKEIHKIARDAEGKGASIIIIGDPNHDEVRGIAGQLKERAIVIDRPENIPLAKIKKLKYAGVVVQSTQNLQQVLKIVGILKKHIKRVDFFNTICAPTRFKQEEIKKMPLQNDAVVIIGSKSSANTRRLFEISKSLNSKSYWIESKKGIKESWFRGAKSVGISAGASTPDETTREVIKYIRGLA